VNTELPLQGGTGNVWVMSWQVVVLVSHSDQRLSDFINPKCKHYATRQKKNYSGGN
jgi:hypothetical protein